MDYLITIVEKEGEKSVNPHTKQFDSKDDESAKDYWKNYLNDYKTQNPFNSILLRVDYINKKLHVLSQGDVSFGNSSRNSPSNN